MRSTRAEVFAAIDAERAYQDAKWGDIAAHPHILPRWLKIAIGEITEAAEAFSQFSGDQDVEEVENTVKAEMLQTAAVIVAALEQHGVIPGHGGGGGSVSESRIGDRVRIVGGKEHLIGAVGVVVGGDYALSGMSRVDVEMLDGSYEGEEWCVEPDDLTKLDTTKALQGVLLMLVPDWSKAHTAKWHEITGTDDAMYTELDRLVRSVLTEAEVAEIDGLGRQRIEEIEGEQSKVLTDEGRS